MILKPNLQQSRARVMALSCLALVGGVAVGSGGWLSGVSGSWLLVAVCLAALTGLWYWPKRLAAVFLILAAFLLGYWRYQSVVETTAIDVTAYLDQEVEIVGRLITEPIVRAGYQSFIIRPNNLRGAIAVYADLSSAASYGDVIKLTCFLERPSGLEDFDAARYWRRFGVYGLCYFGNWELRERDRGHWFYKQIVEWRRRIAAMMKTGLPYPESDLGGALVFGVGDKLNAELRAAFSRSGLTHVIAISGLNVSLLVILLFNGTLFLGCRRRISLGLSLVAVGLYVMTVGAPASAVRAGLMGVLLLLALWLGRLNKLINALVLAAAVTLLNNPFLLRDDIGWQLSFLALLGIIYIYPILRRRLASSYVVVDFLLDGLSLTLAAQLATWPIIAAGFQQLSLVAPLANLVAVWITPVILSSVFLAVFLSSIWSWWLWWLVPLLSLKYLIGAALFFSQWSWAAVSVKQIGPIFLAIYYIAAAVIVCVDLKLAKTRKKVLN